jgi:hypothetical protein
MINKYWMRNPEFNTIGKGENERFGFKLNQGGCYDRHCQNTSRRSSEEADYGVQFSHYNDLVLRWGDGCAHDLSVVTRGCMQPRRAALSGRLVRVLLRAMTPTS